MFPWVHEFKWEFGHIIFTGGFTIAAVVIGITIMLAIKKLISIYRQHNVDKVLWHAAFEDFPAKTRICRHEMSGALKHRTCDNFFDCGECEVNKKLMEKGIVEAVFAGAGGDGNVEILGLNMPLDRMYHRGHTWVKRENDGTFTIGLDDFGKRLIGKPDEIILPEIGTRLHTNGTGWNVKLKNADTRILSPVDGEVVETGGDDKGWYLRVKPVAGIIDTSHLLKGREVKGWLMRELERLQFALATDGVGASLADGGILIDDLPKAHPDADWDGVFGEMFLEP
jgi:hypothetical protein